MNLRKLGLVITLVFGAVLLIACSPSSKIATPASTSAPAAIPTPVPVSSVPAVSEPATATAAATETPNDQILQSAAVCGTIQDHLYEACFAYVWNDAHLSLQPYYKYVHSDSLLSGLKNRLALKYFDQAFQTIQQRAANWPRGTNAVDGPDITIVAARSSLTCDKAVLTTRENWTVRAPDGAVLYQESQQLHTVVLHRIPDERFQYDGHVLHQWAVYALYDGEQNLSVC